MITIYTPELDFNLFSPQKKKEEKKIYLLSKMALTRLEHWLQYSYFKRPGSLCSILQWQIPIKNISAEKKMKDRDSSYQPAHC